MSPGRPLEGAEDAGRDLPRDAVLQTALRHAPDADAAPPDLVKARVLAAARRSAEQNSAQRSDSVPATLSGWRSWFSAAGAWRLGGAGTLAAAVLASAVLWTGREAWLREPELPVVAAESSESPVPMAMPTPVPVPVPLPLPLPLPTQVAEAPPAPVVTTRPSLRQSSQPRESAAAKAVGKAETNADQTQMAAAPTSQAATPQASGSPMAQAPAITRPKPDPTDPTDPADPPVAAAREEASLLAKTEAAAAPAPAPAPPPAPSAQVGAAAAPFTAGTPARPDLSWSWATPDGRTGSLPSELRLSLVGSRLAARSALQSAEEAPGGRSGSAASAPSAVANLDASTGLIPGPSHERVAIYRGEQLLGHVLPLSQPAQWCPQAQRCRALDLAPNLASAWRALLPP